MLRKLSLMQKNGFLIKKNVYMFLLEPSRRFPENLAFRRLGSRNLGLFINLNV